MLSRRSLIAQQNTILEKIRYHQNLSLTIKKQLAARNYSCFLPLVLIGVIGSLVISKKGRGIHGLPISKPLNKWSKSFFHAAKSFCKNKARLHLIQMLTL